MFVPKVAKPQTKAAASLVSSLAPLRSTFSGPRPASDPVDDARLQRTIGNQAMQLLLQEQGAEPDGSISDHKPEAASEDLIVRARSCGTSWDFGKTPMFPPDGTNCPQARSRTRHSPLRGAIQQKLAIGAVNDPLEHEADRAADAAMRMDESALILSRGPTGLSRKCAACAAEDGDEEGHLQAKPSGRLQAGEPALSSVHSVVAQPGRALEPAARGFLESSFGRSFADVRIHDGGDAATSAAHIGARAYTVGRNIVFGAGEYRPATPEGRWLLAHELTHVVQQGSAPSAPGARAPRFNPSPVVDSVVQRETPSAGEPAPTGQPVATSDAGAADGGASQATADGGAAQGDAAQLGTNQGTQQRICGPDITTSLTTVLGKVEPWFKGLTGFQQSRSCTALGPGGFLVGVNPGMAWDTRELFLPNTGWLDAYFRRKSCGSPRDPGCDTDPHRLLCETPATCGNSVVVDGKCMLAGTANYALFGKLCRLCHDYNGSWNRWDMRAIIGVWKTVDWDDSTPPKEVASAAYDGTFPTVPAAAENRGTCTGRCGLTHGGVFDFIWEPYKPR